MLRRPRSSRVRATISWEKSTKRDANLAAAIRRIGTAIASSSNQLVAAETYGRARGMRQIHGGALPAQKIISKESSWTIALSH